MNNAYYACLLLATTCVHADHDLIGYHTANTTTEYCNYSAPTDNLRTQCTESYPDTQGSLDFITRCLYACFEGKQRNQQINTQEAQNCYRTCARKVGLNGASHLVPTIEYLGASLLFSGIVEPLLEHVCEIYTDRFAEYMVNRNKK